MSESFSIKYAVLRLALWFSLIAFIMATAIAMFSNFRNVAETISAIQFAFLPLVIISVLFNYFLRFVKWCYFLWVIDIKVPFRQNLWIFFSAFTMVLSPGKMGELVKSFLLKSRFEVPVAKTAPVVMAERITDLIGLMILCLVGLWKFAFGGRTILAVALLVIGAVFVITRPGFWGLILSRVKKSSRFNKFHRPVSIIKDSSCNLLSFRSLLISSLLSAISWAGEGIALYLIFISMNVELPELLSISIFAQAFCSIIGALSFIPGGLFATEASMGVFFVYVAIPEAQAVSATMLIRTLTLWFAVILGTIVFIAGHRRSDLKALSFKTSEKVAKKHDFGAKCSK